MRAIVAFLFILLFTAGICKCQVLHVPSEYPTIQAAIDAAENLDTVLVSEGIYYENVKFNGKNLVLASNYIFTHDFETVRNTVINGSRSTNPDSASCVSFNNMEDEDAVLEGFTITGGTGTKYGFSFGPFQEGGGVILHYSSAIVRNNIIINNNVVAAPGAQRGGGGGIASMYGSPTICNNVIVSNDAGYAGGIVLNWSGGKIMNNIVYHNIGGASFGTGGIMIWEPTTSTVVENNTIVGNISLKDAGGMNINSDISVVKNNIIWGNRQVSGKQVVNPQRGNFNNMEDYSDANNISQNPMFAENTFILHDSSFCIDAGDPDEQYNDLFDPLNTNTALSPSKGTIKNDIGAYGGVNAKALPEINVDALFLSKTNVFLSCNVGVEVNTRIPMLNQSSHKLQIHKISHTDTTNFSFNYVLDSLQMFETDTLRVNFKPSASGNFSDTVKIYLADTTSPIIIVVRGMGNAVTGVSDDGAIQYDFKLNQNYPNPFNPQTNFEFQIANPGFVTLKIYDILGNEVATLVNEEKLPGIYSVEFDASNLPAGRGGLSSGVYFHILKQGTNMLSGKMILLK